MRKKNQEVSIQYQGKTRPRLPLVKKGGLREIFLFFALFIFPLTLAVTPNPANVDSDGDGISNASDACPFIPSNGNSDGCPIFSVRPYAPVKSTGVKIKINSQLVQSGLGNALSPDLKYSLYEQTQIQIGDTFRAVIRNPKTGKILSESERVEVKN